jgi:hypothetical protein
LAVGDVGRPAAAVRVDVVGLERLGLPTPTEQPRVVLAPVTRPLEECDLLGPGEGAARVPPVPSVDDRAAEPDHLCDREEQDTDQPRGREDRCQDAPEHRTDYAAGSHLRSRDECAHARLNGLAEGGLEFGRTIGQINHRRSAAWSG